MGTCHTIQYLHALAADPGNSLGKPASHALAIISDIEAHGVKRFDIQCLGYMLEPLFEGNREALFDHLQQGAPDCDICAAIKERLAGQWL